MRFITIGGLTLALLGLTAAGASAQDSWNTRQDTGSRWVHFQGGIFADVMNFPAEVSGISTTGTPGPDTKSEANTNLSYEIAHQVFGAVVGVHLAPPNVKGLDLEFGIFAGSATTSIDLDVDEGSVLLPAGNPMDDTHQTMSDRGGDVAFGFHMRGTYRIQDIAFAGLSYQFLSGSGEINNDIFFNDTVDGSYTFTRHRIDLLGGVQAGPARPYLGLGFLLYEGNADLKEGDDPTNPDTWDADFEPTDQFRLFLGCEVTQGMLGARVDLVFLPAIGTSVTVFVRF